jgi:hypothetical protein
MNHGRLRQRMKTSGLLRFFITTTTIITTAIIADMSPASLWCHRDIAAITTTITTIIITASIAATNKIAFERMMRKTGPQGPVFLCASQIMIRIRH